MNRRNLLSLCYFIPAILLIGACSNTSKYLTEPMPESGFLPNYKLLQAVPDTPQDIRMCAIVMPMSILINTLV